jgi:hypothetical protein
LKIFEEIYDIEDVILGEGCSSVVKVCRLKTPNTETKQDESKSDFELSSIKGTPNPSTFSKLRGGRIIGKM